MSMPILGHDTNVYFKGDTASFQTYDSVNAIGATLDGVLWSAATGATLYLLAPDGTVTPITATKTAPGIFRADVAAGVLNQASLESPNQTDWERFWRMTDGTNTKTYGRWTFTVQDIVRE